MRPGPVGCSARRARRRYHPDGPGCPTWAVSTMNDDDVVLTDEDWAKAREEGGTIARNATIGGIGLVAVVYAATAALLARGVAWRERAAADRGRDRRGGRPVGAAPRVARLHRAAQGPRDEQRPGGPRSPHAGGGPSPGVRHASRPRLRDGPGRAQRLRRRPPGAAPRPPDVAGRAPRRRQQPRGPRADGGGLTRR